MSALELRNASIRAGAAAGLFCAVLVVPVSSDGADTETDTLWSALTGGKPDFVLRVRYEYLEDDQIVNGRRLKDADALTARLALGYQTGVFHGFGSYVQLEAVGAVVDDYYKGYGTSKKQYATVVDPEGTELKQGYVSYTNALAEIKAGRQIITYRKAPFHRFMGTVEWRQHWQTHDAVTVKFDPVENLVVNYGYIWDVNRIYGEDAPEPLSDFDSNSHVVNVQYAGLPHLHLEAYAYLFDFTNADRFSSNTFGVRGSGTYPINDRWTTLYAAEYAHQTDAAENPFDYSEDYVLAEGGLSYSSASFVKSVTAKFSYELLGGDGNPNSAFVTILGTNHAFQGWADRFVVTPNSGIEDFYVTGVAAMNWDMKLIMSYHNLNSDAGSFDYGDEFDVQLTKTFKTHYLLGAQASFYDADPSARNAAGPPSADATGFWLWGEVTF